jgi:hypothetical protein
MTAIVAEKQFALALTQDTTVSNPVAGSSVVDTMAFSLSLDTTSPAIEHGEFEVDNLVFGLDLIETPPETTTPSDDNGNANVGKTDWTMIALVVAIAAVAAIVFATRRK